MAKRKSKKSLKEATITMPYKRYLERIELAAKRGAEAAKERGK